MSTYFSEYANSVYNNLKSYIDVLRSRVTALETRIITNYGVVQSGGLSLGTIIANANSNYLLDRIVTGNAYGPYAGRATNHYPNVTAPNGSTAYLITSEAGSTYNVYSMLKNSSGQWEYWVVSSGVSKGTMTD